MSDNNKPLSSFTISASEKQLIKIFKETRILRVEAFLARCQKAMEVVKAERFEQEKAKQSAQDDIEKVVGMLAEADVDQEAIRELLLQTVGRTNNTRKRRKAKPKYRWSEHGLERTWNGMGKMPKFLRAQKENGVDIDDKFGI